MRRPKTAAVTATDTAMTAPQMRRRRHSLPIDRVRARLQRPESCTSSAARDLHVAPAVPSAKAQARHRAWPRPRGGAQQQPRARGRGGLGERYDWHVILRPV